MKQWRIKTKRDWGIAAGFLFLGSYLAASKYQQRINEWLMEFSPEKMSTFNQPEKHGVYLAALFLAAVFFSVLWIWQRKSEEKRFGKGLAAVWILTAVLSGSVWFSYQTECRQIVHTPDEGLKAEVGIFSWDKELPELTEEEQQKLLELCLNLKAPSKEEQEELRSRIDEEDEINIDIRYPKYKNHSYQLWFILEEDVIRLNRGHSASDAVYYDGAEVRELVERILVERR